MTLPRLLILASLASLASTQPGLAGQDGRTYSQTPPPAADTAPPSAIRLFAGVEEAWGMPDIDRLASLLDTTAVRISIKPGVPLTSALTRVAAAFLLKDQLSLVRTEEFRLTRFDCDKKRDVCRAIAIWTGDWGGRQGRRAVRVTLTARGRAKRWLLTEIRAED